ncbi:MAG: hypothetical protein WB525_09420 [Pseudolabrys sp.]|jgi:hypothetical protein
MSGFYFAIDGEPKDLRQSECGSDLNACADQCQVVYGAGKFLSGWTELDDSASMRGDAGVLSTISHCRDRSFGTLRGALRRIGFMHNDVRFSG